MSAVRFEWDIRKSAVNAKKHGVSFEEARSVFYDERARLIDDPGHSEDQERFVLLGLSSSLRLLLVCHCYRSAGDIIRITIRLDQDSITYFKVVSEEVGIPYQSLINLYLRDCAASHRKPSLNWK